MLRSLLCTLVTLAIAGCASGPRLSVGPSQAEFPFGNPVRADGGVDPTEWVTARTLTVRLADGRSVDVLMQRDRENFNFAFVGLDGPANRRVEPEVLLDLWGNRTSTWDQNDWWIRIGLDDCWARGGWGEGDCAPLLDGIEANNLPLNDGEAVEVSVSFDFMGFDENYDSTIGMAFRFVDDTGQQVGVWPLRAEVDDPSTWAPVSLRH